MYICTYVSLSPSTGGVSDCGTRGEIAKTKKHRLGCLLPSKAAPFAYQCYHYESHQRTTRVEKEGVLQCVAVCYRVLQCLAVCCSAIKAAPLAYQYHRYESRPRTTRMETEGVLQCVAVSCSVLQYVAVRCSVLQCVGVRCSVVKVMKSHPRTAPTETEGVLQYVAVCCCSVLLCVATFSHSHTLSLLPSCTNATVMQTHIFFEANFSRVCMCARARSLSHPPTLPSLAYQCRYHATTAFMEKKRKAVVPRVHVRARAHFHSCTREGKRLSLSHKNEGGILSECHSDSFP